MPESEEKAEMDYESLITEASRQLNICNACRYCEGFCPVWDVIEYRKKFGRSDVEYIANLCHDCGQCFDVCPFTPPNKFSVNIPAVLSEVRTQTYKEYTVPGTASVLFEKQAALPVIAFATSFITLLVVYFLTGSSTRLFYAISGPGSFYDIIPNVILDVAGLLLAFFIVLVWIASGLKFIRSVNGSGSIRPSDYLAAASDSFGERWFKGGGAGCNYPDREARGSYKKLAVHSLVLYGFLLDLLATMSAFVEQDFMHILPPYPLISVPVLSGLVGGIMIIVGVVLFLIYDKLGTGFRKKGMKKMDSAFLITLSLTAFTGILLFSMRGTNLMGSLLLIHLSVVAVLFVTAPYGKFVHLVYRYLSIAKYRQEKRVYEGRNI
ncbi:tricarballylate utilization protein B [Thermoplasmatales archaeon]|nr:tricarballylate utilization protein B [Thermoplasmatales archaeon]